MGRTSDWAIEVAEENYREQREEWIRHELGNPDADESTDGWSELEVQYDNTFTDWDIFLEGEYEWHRNRDHSNFYIEFLETIEDIKRILNSSLEPTVIHTVYKMTHIHAVTAMETYLGDSLKSAVLGNKKYIENAAKNLE